MKKFLSLILASILVFCFSACEKTNDVSAWYNSEKAKSNTRDGYLGSWVWGQYYEETLCYDREINIELIDNKQITFTIDYYRIWSSDIIVAEISKRGIGYFETDELMGEIYIDSNNILHLNIEESNLTMVDSDNIQYSKNTDVEDYNSSLTDDNDNVNAFDENVHNQTQQFGSSSVVEESYEPIITHVAIQGAIIIKQDGSPQFTYKRKCENCGFIESSTVHDSGYSGKRTSGFYCSKCGCNQPVEIEHYKN